MSMLLSEIWSSEMLLPKILLPVKVAVHNILSVSLYIAKYHTKTAFNVIIRLLLLLMLGQSDPNKQRPLCTLKCKFGAGKIHFKGFQW